MFLKLPLNVFYQTLFFLNAIRMIGHHARLRDVTGQSYACTRANQARYSSVQVIFCGSWKHNL